MNRVFIRSLECSFTLTQIFPGSCYSFGSYTMPQGLRVDVSPPSGRIAEWLLLLVRLPGEKANRAGVLLLDVASDKLYVALADKIGGNEEIIEVWAELKEDLEKRASEIGGATLLDSLENELSHFLQIGGPRHQISTTNPAKTLADLFRQQVLKRGHLARGT